MLWIIHHWLLPVIGAGTWFGMLVAMLVVWLVQSGGGGMYYAWQDGSIAFISDIGASGLQPLFIAGCSVMAACFVLSVAAERLLRHKSRLPRNMRETERVLSYLAITGAAIGGIGIVLVSCLNDHYFPHIHDGCLLIFIVGVALSAIFSTIEFRFLDSHHVEGEGLTHADHVLLRSSYIFKAAIVSLEIVLAIVFAVCLFVGDSGHPKVHNAAAVLEWTIAFLFTFYLLSFAADLWPAAKASPGDYLPGAEKEKADGERRAYELGTTGGGTAIATGDDASTLVDGRRVHSGNVAVRHFDDAGRTQQPV